MTGIHPLVLMEIHSSELCSFSPVSHCFSPGTSEQPGEGEEQGAVAKGSGERTRKILCHKRKEEKSLPLTRRNQPRTAEDPGEEEIHPPGVGGLRAPCCAAPLPVDCGATATASEQLRHPSGLAVLSPPPSAIQSSSIKSCKEKEGGEGTELPGKDSQGALSEFWVQAPLSEGLVSGMDQPPFSAEPSELFLAVS